MVGISSCFVVNTTSMCNILVSDNMVYLLAICIQSICSVCLQLLKLNTFKHKESHKTVVFGGYTFLINSF